MSDERATKRWIYLDTLDRKEDPYRFWPPDEVVGGYSDTQIHDALHYWEQKGYIEVQHSIGDRGLSPARITAAGRDYAEEVRRSQEPEPLFRAPAVRAQPVQSCFVIMPFQDPFNTYYTGIIKPAVEAASLICVRADEITRPGAIYEQIWQGIRAAAVCVAELTGQRSNVMYELGLAHALGKPVVSLVQTMDDIPFDLRHLRHIVYTTSAVDWASSLRGNLQASLIDVMVDPEFSLAFKDVGDRAARWG